MQGEPTSILPRSDILAEEPEADLMSSVPTTKRQLSDPETTESATTTAHPVTLSAPPSVALMTLSSSTVNVNAKTLVRS